ncbi:MAG: dihydroorotate dehydrogenase electron transfer subunit [Candidatus Gracilibacteria bacterium]|nr:dihydroorotate dehydrogenase electron transfer subunit [Candidatus Gracilibacteria bacterium]
MPKTAEVLDIKDSAKGIKTFVLKIENLGSFPGQFVNLWIGGLDEKPFSIAKDTGSELHLTIAQVGEFTKALFQMKKGDKVGIRGPFGRSFSICENKNIVLVGGGFGTAPLHFLAEEHIKKGSRVKMLIGARSADLVVFEDECRASGIETLISTNDGSKGTQGFITQVLEQVIQDEKVDMIQTCGPELMMKAIAEMAQKKNIACELSVERYMKCGFGVCGQCVLNGKRMCIDGPTVTAEFALNQKEFGVFTRDAEGRRKDF